MRTRTGLPCDPLCGRVDRRRWLAGATGLAIASVCALGSAPVRAQSFMGQLLEVLKSSKTQEKSPPAKKSARWRPMSLRAASR